jgi:pimeloyl-ACP methyl ester carboxylesterase
MSRTDAATPTGSSTDLHVEAWGDGTPVVLVHGSLASAAGEWPTQRPLAEEGFRLLAPDRRGYGLSPAADGEDFLRDADDVVALMGDGAHLVGHSYGGLAVLFAAARRPEATLSIALLEPAAFALAQHDPAARELVSEIRGMWNDQVPDAQWVVSFLKAVGSDPVEFPPEFLARALPLVPALRRGRPMWYPELPLAELRAAPFPRLVVSAATVQRSTPSAMTWPPGSAPPEQSSKGRDTRSSSLAQSTTPCCPSGAIRLRRSPDDNRQDVREREHRGCARGGQ